MCRPPLADHDRELGFVIRPGRSSSAARSAAPGPITAVGNLANTVGVSGIGMFDSSAWSR